MPEDDFHNTLPSPFVKKSPLAKRIDYLPAEIEEKNDIVVSDGSGGMVVKVSKKNIKVSGKVHNIDPYQLMRMIKHITQSIGTYKEMENPYSSYVIVSLRSSRNHIVSDLEEHFGIHWKLDDSGTSIFFM